MRHYGAWQRAPPWERLESARKVSAGIAPCPAMERILGCVGVQVNQLHAALSMHTADTSTVAACHLGETDLLSKCGGIFARERNQPAVTPLVCAVFLRLYNCRSAACNSSGAVRPSSG